MPDVVIFETFNPLTILSALVTGFMFGWLAFLPFVRALIGDGAQPAQTARQAFWLTFSVTFLTVGAVVTVFYTEQITTELVAVNGFDPLPWRAFGRYLTFVVYLLCFSAGVAFTVWREYRRRPPDERD